MNILFALLNPPFINHSHSRHRNCDPISKFYKFASRLCRHDQFKMAIGYPRDNESEEREILKADLKWKTIGKEELPEWLKNNEYILLAFYKGICSTHVSMHERHSSVITGQLSYIYIYINVDMEYNRESQEIERSR